MEIVFFGMEKGEEVVHPGTPIEAKFTGHFARSMLASRGHRNRGYIAPCAEGPIASAPVVVGEQAMMAKLKEVWIRPWLDRKR